MLQQHDWPTELYVLHRALNLLVSLLAWLTAGLIVPWDSCGDLDDIGSGGRFAAESDVQKHLLLQAVYVVLPSQCSGKDRTANDHCQTSLLQLTCSVNVEPSDPDLEGNHCKYFLAISLKSH